MTPLRPGTSYHIFNHANGFENVFLEDENFRYFLEKYKLHISPIAETYAYCLLPNHFHLVVRIRKLEVIEELIRSKKMNNFSNNNFSTNNFSKVTNFGKVEIEKFLSKQFANLFSSYTQSFNKVYNRMGSLFLKNFRREVIADKEYFLNCIVYIHRNPIHHGFCKNYHHWGYCSYFELMDGKNNIIEIEKLFKTFGGKNEFREMHMRSLDKFFQQFELDV